MLKHSRYSPTRPNCSRFYVGNSSAIKVHQLSRCNIISHYVQHCDTIGSKRSPYYYCNIIHGLLDCQINLFLLIVDSAYPVILHFGMEVDPPASSVATATTTPIASMTLNPLKRSNSAPMINVLGNEIPVGEPKPSSACSTPPPMPR